MDGPQRSGGWTPPRIIATAAAILIALAVAGSVAYALANPVEKGTDLTGFALRVNFGLREGPLTRSTIVSLCDYVSDPETVPECASDTPVRGTNTDTTQRPEVTSVAILGDLAQVSETGNLERQCDRLPRGTLFPASQAKVTAENQGSSNLVVSVAADPSTPEEVSPGTYCSFIRIQRAGTSTGQVDIPILATVGDRGQGGVRVRVVWALLLGALAGAGLKWFGDRYPSLAGIRRRQRRLVSRLGCDPDCLPERARYDLEVIDDGIASYDAEGVEQALTELETHSDELARFREAMAEVSASLTRLADTETDLADLQPPIAAVQQELRARHSRLLGEPFPWDERTDDVVTRAQDLRRLTLDIENAATPESTNYQPLVEEHLGPLTTGPTSVEIPPHRRSQATRRRDRWARTVPEFLLDNAVLLTLIVSALVVTVLGYQTQFVHDDTFDGGQGDYLALFVWAFAIQVAGVTMLDIAGRLISRTTVSEPTTTTSNPS